MNLLKLFDKFNTTVTLANNCIHIFRRPSLCRGKNHSCIEMVKGLIAVSFAAVFSLVTPGESSPGVTRLKNGCEGDQSYRFFISNNWQPHVLLEDYFLYLHGFCIYCRMQQILCHRVENGYTSCFTQIMRSRYIGIHQNMCEFRHEVLCLLTIESVNNRKVGIFSENTREHGHDDC